MFHKLKYISNEIRLKSSSTCCMEFQQNHPIGMFVRSTIELPNQKNIQSLL